MVDALVIDYEYGVGLVYLLHHDQHCLPHSVHDDGGAVVVDGLVVVLSMWKPSQRPDRETASIKIRNPYFLHLPVSQVVHCTVNYTDWVVDCCYYY